MERSRTLGYKIRLIHNQVHKRMEAKRIESGDDMTGMQRWIIGFLEDHGEQDVYQRDIEAAFSISRATASNMLQAMERKGMVERVPVEHDARLKKLVMTEKAANMVRKAKDDVDGMERLLREGLTDEDVGRLLGYLDQILKNLGVEGAGEGRCLESAGEGVDGMHGRESAEEGLN